jgi:hypothetical protein
LFSSVVDALTRSKLAPWFCGRAVTGFTVKLVEESFSEVATKAGSVHESVKFTAGAGRSFDSIDCLLEFPADPVFGRIQ